MNYSRSKYRCTIPVAFRWRSTGQWRDVQIWLLDNVPNHGDYDLNPVGHYPRHIHDRLCYFAHEKDAIMFALRWA